MAAENCLWGAPRIHGELLTLGITISERTVSRYLRGRPTTRSQTWRTFFANHLRGQTLISPVMFADAHDEDIVVDPCDRSFRPAPSIDASRASIHRPSVDWGRPLQPSSVGARLGKNHVQDGTDARKSSGRDPPRHLPLQPASRAAPGLRRPCRLSFVCGDNAFATDGSVRSICPRVLGPIAVLSLNSKNNRVAKVVARRHFVQSARWWRRDLHSGENIGEPQDRPVRLSQGRGADQELARRLESGVHGRRCSGPHQAHDFRRTAVRNPERDGVSRSAAMAMVGHKTKANYPTCAICS